MVKVGDVMLISDNFTELASLCVGFGSRSPAIPGMAEIKEIEAEVLSITQAKPPISKAKIDSIVALALKHHRVCVLSSFVAELTLMAVL